MYSTCTEEHFHDCHKRHPSIHLEIQDFKNQKERDAFYQYLKKAIESKLGSQYPTWVYLAKTEGHLQNATTESHIRKGSKDPHGNRDKVDEQFGQPLQERKN